MDVFDCIKTRRSIRKFTKNPVEFDKLGRIMEAGHFAPSPGNLQNWKFVLVTDKDMIDKAYKAAFHQECIFNATAIIVVCCLTDRIERWYGEKGKMWGIQGVAAAVQNMLLAAHALGLGAVWVGAFDSKEIKDIFKIPTHAEPHAIVAIGHPDEQPQCERDDLYNMTRFNTYNMPVKDLDGYLRDYSVKFKKSSDKAKQAGKEMIGKGVQQGAKQGGKLLHRIKHKLGMKKKP